VPARALTRTPTRTASVVLPVALLIAAVLAVLGTPAITPAPAGLASGRTQAGPAPATSTAERAPAVAGYIGAASRVAGVDGHGKPPLWAVLPVAALLLAAAGSRLGVRRAVGGDIRPAYRHRTSRGPPAPAAV
jgi:hypothetical protein